jgi:Tfp pilus assembly protein PilF
VAEFALSAGHTAQARAHVNKAISLDSTDAHPHVVMASIYRREGRQDAAIRELEKAAAMEPGDIVATAQLAGALAGAGRVDEARSLIVRLEQQAREGLPVQALIAPIYMSLGEVDEAIDWMRQANEKGRRSFYMMPPGERRAFDALLENPIVIHKLDSLGIRIELRRDSTRRGPDRPPAPQGGRSGSPQGR